ncbi:LytR/AlgR family response regulator transcription factor [Parapedobacter tibetensis]|nr:LytTR family DNA-binding domain-containing protein [Parapedobacter tibetensis]
MPSLKTYILDDDTRAVRKLSKLVYGHPQLILVGSSTDPETGIAEIRRYRPDVVLLDLEMQPLTGWEVMQHLDSSVNVILCTADDRAGSRAFEVSAAEYLVKPFSRERFNVAIQRVWETICVPGHPLIPPAESSSCWLTSGGASHKVQIDFVDIEVVEAQKDHCIVYHTDGKITVDQSLKELERMLPVRKFMRIHRGFIIALNRYYRHSNGNVYLKNVQNKESKSAPIGDTYSDRLYAYLDERLPHTGNNRYKK